MFFCSSTSPNQSIKSIMTILSSTILTSTFTFSMEPENTEKNTLEQIFQTEKIDQKTIVAMNEIMAGIADTTLNLKDGEVTVQKVKKIDSSEALTPITEKRRHSLTRVLSREKDIKADLDKERIRSKSSSSSGGSSYSSSG